MNRSALLMTSLFGLSLSITGCTTESKAIPCSSNTDCEAGSVCVDDVCTTAECLTSAECNIGEHCSSSFVCTTGCMENADCVAGEACSDGTCAPYGCRDTHMDCNYGEFCDTTTGLCFPDDSGICSACDPGTDRNCYGTTEKGPCTSSGDCPSNQECYVTEWDDSFTCFSDADCSAGEVCGTISDGAGNVIGPHCFTTACYEGRSLTGCDPNVPNECARGFQCQDFGSGNGICYGDCGWLIENGYL
jgi:hypothetical protein